MNKKQFFFLFFLAIYYSSNCYGDGVGIFDFLSSDKTITQDKNNCKLISFKGDNLDYIIQKDLQQFELDIPTIDNNFIRCSLKKNFLLQIQIIN